MCSNNDDPLFIMIYPILIHTSDLLADPWSNLSSIPPWDWSAIAACAPRSPKASSTLLHDEYPSPVIACEAVEICTALWCAGYIEKFRCWQWNTKQKAIQQDWEQCETRHGPAEQNKFAQAKQCWDVLTLLGSFGSKERKDANITALNLVAARKVTTHKAQ